MPTPCGIAEEGLRNGHYDALTRPWEQTFFLLPLAPRGGPGPPGAAASASWPWPRRSPLEAPERLKPLYRYSASQARGHLEVIARFGRYPHRNPVLGRVSTPEEAAYLDKGDFVHTRPVPPM